MHLFYLFYFILFFCLTLGFVTWRYRLPLTLVYFPFAGYFLVNICQCTFKKEVKGLAFPGLIFVISLGAAFLIPLPQGMAAKDMKKAKEKMNFSNREKILWQQKALSPLDRENRILLQIARLRAAQQDLEGAVHILSQAVSPGSGKRQILLELARLYSRMGLKDQAGKARLKYSRHKNVNGKSGRNRMKNSREMSGSLESDF